VILLDVQDGGRVAVRCPQRPEVARTAKAAWAEVLELSVKVPVLLGGQQTDPSAEVGLTVRARADELGDDVFYLSGIGVPTRRET
jgi:hypothetical protein